MALKIMMEYWQKEGSHRKSGVPSANQLYRVGLNRRSYLFNVGWRHTGLVGLAKLYGFKRSRAYDLAPWKMSKAEALIILKREVDKYPVIVSVYSNYIPRKGGHLPVLLSLNRKRAVLLDPNTKNRKKVKIKISAKKFLDAWKQRFIVIRP